MRKLPLAALVAGLLTVGAMAAPAGAQMPPPLPTPMQFVSNLDVRCYKLPYAGNTLQLDHLNPVFSNVSPEFVTLEPAQELCVPVYKNTNVPPNNVMPFISFVDWRCYGITGPPLNMKVTLTHLNPIFAQIFGGEDATVMEPQQLCVPVQKNNAVPPPGVIDLIKYLDVKCYRITTPRVMGGEPITLTHLNPLIHGTEADIPIDGPSPVQLCVPVKKNGMAPVPAAVANIVSFSDVICYNLTRAMPLNMTFTLTQLNPVLVNLGYPIEQNIFVGASTRLCVPVAKNNMMPPNQ